MSKHAVRVLPNRSPTPPGQREAERAAFVTRLMAVAELVGSVNALAKRAGLSQAGVRSYLFGSEPTRPVLYALADAAGVTRRWLFTGDGPMFGGGWERRADALERARKAWDVFCRTRCGGESPADAAEFAALYRNGDEALGLPDWVRLAVPDPLPIIDAHAAGAAEPSQRPTERASTRFNVLDGLFARVARELQERESDAHARCDSRSEALSEVFDAVCRDLVSGALALGRAPDTATIRDMIHVHMWRAGLLRENLGAHNAVPAGSPPV